MQEFRSSSFEARPFLIPQLNILLWGQPARPSSLYYGRNLPFVNLVDQSMKLYGLGKTIRRKIRLTFQQLLSSYVLVSRDVIPIGFPNTTRRTFDSGKEG